MKQYLLLLSLVFSSKVVQFEKGKASFYLTDTRYTNIPYYTEEDLPIRRQSVEEYFYNGILEINKDSVVYKSLPRDLSQVGLEMHSIKSVEVEGKRLKTSEYSLNYFKYDSVISSRTGFSSSRKDLFCNLTSQNMFFGLFEAGNYSAVFSNSVSFKSVTLYLSIYGVPHSIYLEQFTFIETNLVKKLGDIVPDKKFDSILLEDKGSFAYVYLVSEMESLIYIYSLEEADKGEFKLKYLNVLLFSNVMRGIVKIVFYKDHLHVLDSSQTIFRFKKINANSASPPENQPETDFMLISQFTFMLDADGQIPINAIDFAIHAQNMYIVSKKRGVFVFEIETNFRQKWNFNNPYAKKIMFYTNPITNLDFLAIATENIAVNEFLTEFVVPPGKLPLLNKIYVSENIFEIESFAYDEYFFYFTNRDAKSIVSSRKGLLYQFDEVLFSSKLPHSGNSFSSKISSVYDIKYNKVSLVWNSGVSPTVLRDLKISGEDIACFFGKTGLVTIKFATQSEVCVEKESPDEVQVCNRELVLQYKVKKPYFANTGGIMGVAILFLICMFIGIFAYIISKTKCFRVNPFGGLRQAKVVDISMQPPNNRI